MAKTKKSRKKYPERAKDVSVTQAMLFEVRDGLSAKIDQCFHEIRQIDSKIDQRFHEIRQIDSKIDQRFHEIKQVDSKIDQRFHEIKLLVEEQNARNRIVLDGLKNLFERQERIENKIS